MSYLALHQKPLSSDLTGRHAWTAHDSREFAVFIAQISSIVALAVIFYLVGPAMGLLLAIVCLAVLAWFRRFAGASDGTGKQGNRAAAAEMSMTQTSAQRPDCDRSGRDALGMVVRQASTS
jgi:hypothetical protein